MADQAKAVTKAASSKKDDAKAASKHPPTSEMVNAALKSLNERNGSSLHAIKKYISATYKVEVEKLSTFIKKYLKSAVANGKVKQTKGIGASGSFKLSAAGTEPKKSVAKKAKHVTGEEKTKKKSPVKTKKLVAKSDEKKKAPAKAASPKKTATASKEKSTKPKAAAIKPKVPKPKTVAAPTKNVAPKTAVAPKKAAAPAKKAAPKKAAASSKK